MNPFVVTRLADNPTPTVADLHDEHRFRRFATLPFDEIAPFVKAALKHRNPVTMAYWLLALLPMLGVLGYLGYAVGMKLGGKGAMGPAFGQFGFGVLVTFLLIPPHEYIHGLAFQWFGAHDVRYGADWRRFVFYATAHRHVLAPRQYTWAALAPFLVISGLLGLAFLLSGAAYPVFFLTAYALHAACCGGDFGIVSYLRQHRDRHLYSYDDVEGKQAFFYEAVSG